MLNNAFNLVFEHYIQLSKKSPCNVHVDFSKHSKTVQTEQSQFDKYVTINKEERELWPLPWIHRKAYFKFLLKYT